jgi:hypothetical protein
MYTLSSSSFLNEIRKCDALISNNWCIIFIFLESFDRILLQVHSQFLYMYVYVKLSLEYISVKLYIIVRIAIDICLFLVRV